MQQCGGLGTVIATPCHDCRGEGRRTEERVEAGHACPRASTTARRLRSTGRGAAAPRGGPAGDLYLHVRVRPHERFERDGVDVHTELHVADDAGGAWCAV